MASPDPKETLAIIKFYQLEYLSTKIYEMIKQISRGTTTSRTQVFEWHRRFCVCAVSLKDATGQEWKSSLDLTLLESV